MRLIDADIARELMERLIARLPTIDPVKHGKWIIMGGPYECEKFKCDQCGYIHEAERYYCPNCGAKMDGGEDDPEG